MVSDILGRIQLTCRFDDGQHSSAVTELSSLGNLLRKDLDHFK